VFGVRVTGATVARIEAPGAGAAARTLVRLEGERGAVGFGEAAGDRRTLAAVRRIASALVGAASVHPSLLPAAGGPSASGAVEMALWDLCGRRLGEPVFALLGGRAAADVAAAGCLALPRAAAANELVRRAKALVADHGLAAFVLGASRRGWRADAKLLAELGREIGARLALDGGFRYAPGESRAIARALAAADLDYVADPWHEAEARADRHFGLPRAARRGLAGAADVARLARAGAVDVVLADADAFGGIGRLAEAAAVARAFALDMGVVAGPGLGLSLAAALHLAAARPEVTRGVIVGQAALADGRLAAAGIAVAGGRFRVPEGPGLGVAVDESLLASAATEEARAARPAREKARQ
jgi:glucarate dehydratase